MKHKLISATAITAIGIGITSLAACAPKHNALPPVSASQKAQAKTALHSELAKCGATSTLAQIRLLQSLKSKTGRQELAAKCGIPPSHRQAFESRALNAAEHGHLTTHDGRVRFLTVTLPMIIMEEQA